MNLPSITDTLTFLLWSGSTSLLDYLAAHVLLCLVPAFIIAGYMAAMIPKEAITRYLAPRAKKWVSYPAAAIGGSILGRKKTAVYVSLVTVFSTLAGLIFGLYLAAA